MSYILYRNAALVFLCAYALIGAVTHITREGAEDVYPFFSWSLFVEVPAREQEDFAALVVKDGAILLDTPIPLSKFAGFDMSGLHVSTLSHELENMGRAVLDGRTAEAARIRAAIENRLTRPIQYQLVRQRFNPLDRFLTGSVASSTIVATYDTNTAP